MNKKISTFKGRKSSEREKWPPLILVGYRSGCQSYLTLMEKDMGIVSVSRLCQERDLSLLPLIQWSLRGVLLIKSLKLSSNLLGYDYLVLENS